MPIVRDPHLFEGVEEVRAGFDESKNTFVLESLREFPDHAVQRALANPLLRRRVHFGINQVGNAQLSVKATDIPPPRKSGDRLFMTWAGGVLGGLEQVKLDPSLRKIDGVEVVSLFAGNPAHN